MATTDELLDALMKDYKKHEDLIGEKGLLKQHTKRLARAGHASQDDRVSWLRKARTSRQVQWQFSKWELQEKG